ncbi:FAD binding domain-containing protein [Sporosarcina sp. FSL W7-1349]|uniref:FAD binding domain-containing protein n=1 Tax=Sporosarcina sp. FSL W7-1349 TaxID=2921561 RepID=UPI0030FA0684
MIPFNFEYFRPETIEEALDLYEAEWKLGKKVIFYSGGTEVITFARGGKLTMDVVIDLKGIPECNTLAVEEDQLVIGSAVTLNDLADSDLFPLAGETVKKIADHTSNNKITVGGNLLSRLPYREAMLPLLVTDALAVTAGPKEKDILPVESLVKTDLPAGGFLTQIKVPLAYIQEPYLSLKRTRTSVIGYPIVSLAALVATGRIRIAFSGVSNLPFRSSVIEGILNESSLSVSERVQKAIAKLPVQVMDDFLASEEYREYTLSTLLTETIQRLEASL